MKIAICEDNLLQLDLIYKYISEWGDVNNIDLKIYKFISGEQFLFEWEDKNDYDIIFLDIYMKKVSGLELSNIIRQKNKVVELVFITGVFKHALHGYKVKALNYLLKPIKKEDLYSSLDEAYKKVLNPNRCDEYIIIKTSKQNIKLNYNKVQYCVMFSPYIDIYTTDRKITLRKKISEIEKILPEDLFIRSHRSYIVNLKFIKHVEKEFIILDNNIQIPISRGKYNFVNEKFINYYLC